MDKTISVVFELNGSDMPVIITYKIIMQEDIQVISCSIDQRQHKNWLQLSKFELRSQYNGKLYTALFNEEIQKKNIATSLFVEKVYSDIMYKEHMPVDEAFAL